MANILIVNAHQKWEYVSEGKLNRTLMEQAISFFKEKGFDVLETNISEGYNIEEEIEKHLVSDLVILQTPIFWFNPPSVYKKWVDEVFMTAMFQQKMTLGDGRIDGQGTQYGTGGQMRGKKFFISATWNAPEEAFNDVSQVLLKGRLPEDVLFNVALNYSFVGYDLLPNFHCFDVMKKPQPEHYFGQYRQHLERALSVL